MKFHLSRAERAVIDRIGDERFTADYVESWLNCKDELCIKAVKEAWGFYWAVAQMLRAGMVREVC